MTDNPLSALDPSFFKTPHPTGKFEAKLTDDERCAVLGLVKSNVHVQLVADAFAVDRRTVSHIANPSSAHYRKTRSRYNELGHDEFVARYVTPDVVSRVKAARPAEVATAAPGSSAPFNVRAKGKAGFHSVQPEQCNYPHRVEIAVQENGWCYRDLDSADAETWLHNGDASRATSQACYAALLANITDD